MIPLSAVYHVTAAGDHAGFLSVTSFSLYKLRPSLKPFLHFPLTPFRRYSLLHCCEFDHSSSSPCWLKIVPVPSSANADTDVHRAFGSMILTNPFTAILFCLSLIAHAKCRMLRPDDSPGNSQFSLFGYLGLVPVASSILVFILFLFYLFLSSPTVRHEKSKPKRKSPFILFHSCLHRREFSQSKDELKLKNIKLMSLPPLNRLPWLHCTQLTPLHKSHSFNCSDSDINVKHILTCTYTHTYYCDPREWSRPAVCVH